MKEAIFPHHTNAGIMYMPPIPGWIMMGFETTINVLLLSFFLLIESMLRFSLPSYS